MKKELRQIKQEIDSAIGSEVVNAEGELRGVVDGFAPIKDMAKALTDNRNEMARGNEIVERELKELKQEVRNSKTIVPK